jgi:hypothetical protein
MSLALGPAKNRVVGVDKHDGAIAVNTDSSILL